MDERFVTMARESDSEQLLHMIQDAPEDWSAEALDAVRAELGARRIAWDEKTVAPPQVVPSWHKALFVVSGAGVGAALIFLVYLGVNPRFLIGVAAVTGLLGYSVARGAVGRGG